ncbi:hypothetical protein ACIP9H_34150 [Streptomyces sp. NPDC088732]|uniref:hypothetical protein n=1 Tax=Streptomyces sp. NPDC088732 TaxID=3365879 RepID=UPI0038137379
MSKVPDDALSVRRRPMADPLELERQPPAAAGRFPRNAPKGFVMRLDADNDHLMTTRKGHAL